MFVTAHVSAGCYPKSHKGGHLTHRVEVDLEGFPEVARVMCSRVERASILPDRSLYTQDTPTCRACARAMAKESR